MANLSAAEKLRAALQAQEEKKTRTPTQSTGDNASYQFWNIPEGSTATIRFLPDADVNSSFFWVEKQVIRLPFAGQVGGDYPTDKQVTVTVPCVDMFEDKTCPIIAETKPWWKQGPDKEALARIYYKKKSFIFQGFVVNSPFEEQNVPENPIRRFVINPSIFEIIRTSLMNPEMEDLPTDYVGGRDFKIAKTKKGEYANYSTSTWSFRTRPLNDIENVAIQNFGLFNLADFQGTRPDADGIEMIKAMFHASLAGEPFDFDAFGKSYRAYGDRNNQSGDTDALPAARTNAGTTNAGTSKTVQATVANNASADESTDAETVSGDETLVTPKSTKPAASDILDRIRKKTMASG